MLFALAAKRKMRREHVVMFLSLAGRNASLAQWIDRNQDDEMLELKHPDCVCENCDILYIKPKEYQANAASRPRGPA
jgi:hypothetical protein